MKKRKNSLVLKFLIPYIISMFAICIMVYILYFPQYEKRFLKAEESNINNLTVILENRILSLDGKVNIFCSYLEKETDTNKLQNIFSNIVDNDKDIMNIYYGGRIPYKDGGYMLNTVGKLAANYDQTSRGWYKEALKLKDNIVVSEPYLDIIDPSNPIVITFSKAIYDNGNLLGVVGVDILFSKIVEDLEIIKDYELNIINHSGLYLHSPNKSYILKQNIFDDSIISKHKDNILNNSNYGWVEKDKAYISVSAKSLPYILIVSTPTNDLKKSLISLMIILIAVSIVLSSIELCLVLIVAKPISSTLENTIKIIESMSKGNFNISFKDKELNKKDQMGDVMRALNSMQNKLGDIIYSMKKEINGINDSVNIITNGSVNLSDRANSQASSLEELASSVEFVLSSLRETAKNASNAKSMSENVSNATKNGVDAINNTSENMNEISEASKKISEITNTIESIALQTNILALNASVEAARAGEQGKGFAVVASEVRNLALNVGNAAKDISGIVEETIRKIDNGKISVKASSYTLNQIENSVNDVLKLLIDISNAIINEEDSISQINAAVVELNNITQENSKIAEDGANASKNVLDKSKNIVNEVSYFNFN